MDDIFGERHNTTPPILMEPGRVLLAGQFESGNESERLLRSIDATGAVEGESESADPPGDNGSPTKLPLPGQVGGKSPLGKRSLTPAGATTIASASGLHDALLRIHKEKTERREKRHKRDSELQEQLLQLQKEQLELQREEIRLREKKMDQQFALLSKQIELEQTRLMRAHDK
ncbi:hypothetical protein PF008_g29343 [Phytophthora fragariae]|uniref:Uncharacterized protein n=1 Tax=Phytophthora fragariae TaxID=53985 RepID=A0A6G0Q8T8_9STRA|nr:hypothetical protein PF008_g29343 [Phytophthora fragariae]